MSNARRQIDESARREEPDLQESLRRIAAARAESLGLELVDLVIKGSRGGRRLRLDVDRAGPRGATIEDCKRMSEAVGAALDEEELIDSRYVLEVSTPGIDRPLRTSDDFRRNRGRRVVIEVEDSEGARRTVRGVLCDGDGDRVHVRVEGDEELSLPLDEIREARQEAGFGALRAPRAGAGRKQ